MKAKTLSIVTGTEKCISKCPFCVSCECVSDYRPAPKINSRNLRTALRYADKCGVDTICLTSRGEPLLYPDMISEYLDLILNTPNINIPFIELQTNGILISKLKSLRAQMSTWALKGLTHICLSVVHYKDEYNAANYGKNYPPLVETIKTVHDMGFSVRLACIMCNGDGYIHTLDEVFKFIKFAKDNNVEQVVFRPVNEEFRREDAREWCASHLIPDEVKLHIMDEFEKQGTKLMVLPQIGVIYDVFGQNVMFSYPMNATIRQTEGETARNLIFFPDGRLMYEWEKAGVLL